MVEKLNGMPEASAKIKGSDKYPEIHGMVYFYEVYGGTIVMAEVYGLPDENAPGMQRSLLQMPMDILIPNIRNTRNMPVICRLCCLHTVQPAVRCIPEDFTRMMWSAEQ